jgi:endonuclease/exonuclease/phosphatase family metal-dependent hydrolase
LGIFGVLTTIYFSIEAPNVVARWAGISPVAAFLITGASWGIAGWWWLAKGQISKSSLLVWGLVFVLATLISILPHQVDFPATVNGGYPLLAPEIGFLQRLPIYFMLALSPILFLLFVHYLNSIIANQPRLRLLGISFGLGGVFLLVMILSHVFTTVYDYIPVIGPFFRDKYWLVYLVAVLASTLPLLLSGKSEVELAVVTQPVKRYWLGSIGLIFLAILLGVLLTTTSPTMANDQPESLRIFTYNIQQGYNDSGERNFDGQVALVKSTNPDIVGLQESDTARIAGGNADVVAYFANRLDMYSYYGPSPVTGTFGIALLSKYPIQNPHTYFLYSEGEQVAVIQADIVVAGTTYKIYVTHLGNGGPIFQMRQMLDLMRSQENVIAMGDFNYRPYEEQYAITTAEYDDAYTHAAESVAPTTWGEDQSFDIEERIDHIFVSPGTPISYVEYFTQPESDHPGLFAEVRLGK